MTYVIWHSKQNKKNLKHDLAFDNFQLVDNFGIYYPITHLGPQFIGLLVLSPTSNCDSTRPTKLRCDRHRHVHESHRRTPYIACWQNERCLNFEVPATKSWQVEVGERMAFLQQESIRQMAVLAIMSRSPLAPDIVEHNLQKTFVRNAPVNRCFPILSPKLERPQKSRNHIMVIIAPEHL